MKILLISLLIILNIKLIAQNDKVIYSHNYRFKDGLYLNTTQIRNNDPIRIRQIITKIDKNDPEFFSRILAKNTIWFWDKNGQKQQIPSDSVLAVAKKGKLFIYINNDLFPLIFIGNLTYFIATIDVYDYDYSTYYYYDYTTMDTHKETRQYILDLQEGKIYDYNYKNLQILLKKYDKNLYQKYINLPKRKRKKQIFIYIRKFNERHPLYLPKN